MLPRECREEMQTGSLFALGPILETPEELLEPTAAWTVPYEQLSTGRAPWFTNDSSKVNGQHPI